MRDSFFEARNLRAGYADHAVLGQVSFSLRRGELLTLIGPNGGGKSTLLRTLSRHLAPLGGSVLLESEDLGAIPPQVLARRLSVLLTDRVSPERMTCADVVSTGRFPYTGRLGILSRLDWQRVEEAMEQLHIVELAQRPFLKVSDGQKQRVLVARALCQEPELLLLDEPTSYLDVRHKLELLNLLRTLARERKLTVVLSLHELDLAQRVSDRVLGIHSGGILWAGTPEEVFTPDKICALYDLPPGSYDPGTGSFALRSVAGTPRVFVIGGGGLGIPVYRKLYREGIPFAAGVLHENDLDVPVARSLASGLVLERAFEPIGEKALDRALELLEGCECLICAPTSFGTLNRANERLLERSRGRRKCLRAENYLFGADSV